MRSQLLRSQGLRQTMIIMAGSLIASGLSAVSMIIITRQLGPERFGEFAVGFAILLILVRLNDLGMTNVVQKFAAQEDREKAHATINRVFSYSTRVRLVGMLIIWLAGLLLARPLAELLNFSQPAIITMAFFLASATSWYEHVQAMLQALHRFAESAAVNVIQAVLKVLGAGILFLSASTLAIPIFGWYVLAPALPLLAFRKWLPNWVQISLSGDYRQEKNRFASLARHSAIAFVAAGIIENIDVLFVQGQLSTYEAGLLGGVGRVALLFSILAYALASVLNPRVAKYKNKDDLMAYGRKAWLLVLLVVVGMLVYLPISRWVLLLTIGNQYLPGLEIMNILVASSLLTVAVVPFVAIFFSLEKPWYFSVSGLLQLSIILVGNGVFVPIYGLEAAAWTRLLARAVLFVFTLFLAMITLRQVHGNRAVSP